MTVPPPDSRRSEWMADLEELADLAAETVAPAEVPEARLRRQDYSAAGLVALLSGRTPIEAGDEPEPVPVAEPAAQAAPQAPVPLAPVPFVATAAPAAPVRAAVRLPRRRALGTGLAVLGAAVLCAGVLLHMPGPDPAPLTGGPGYTTPSPDVAGGGVAMQPVPLDPASPAPIVAAPLSLQAPGASAARPSSHGGAAPAPQPGVRQAPVVLTPSTPAPAPARTNPPATAPPTGVPTAAPTAAPTATPTASPSATPSGPLMVRSVTLSMGTCENRGSWWICPETSTFTFEPGAQGTLSYSIAGVDVTCSGAQSAFDQAQPSVNIPAGTTRAVVTSAIVFPAGAHPAAPAPGRAPSTAAVNVTSPNRISSASEPFAGASCP